MKQSVCVALAACAVAVSPIIGPGAAYAAVGQTAYVADRPPDDHPCPKAAADPFCGMPDPHPRYKKTPKDVG
jgi:hypothetical protein